MIRCLVNPLCLFLLVWGVSMALYAGGVCTGMFPSPTALTSALVFLNLITFSLGYLTWALFQSLAPATPPLPQAYGRPLTDVALFRALRFTLVMGVIALGLEMYRLAAMARYYDTTWLALIAHPELLRIRVVHYIGENLFQTSGTVMLLSVTNGLFWIGFALLGILLHVDPTWRKYFYLGVFLSVSLTIGLLHLSRYEVTVNVLYLVLAYLFIDSTDRSGIPEHATPAVARGARSELRTSSRRLLLPLAALVLLFTAVNGLLHKSSAYDPASRLQGLLFHFYWYIAAPLAAFNEFIANFQADYQWGQSTFLALYKWLCRFHLAPEIEANYYGEKVFVPYMSNVYTYLRNLYEDFGILGVAVVPYILGWATAAIRARARRLLPYLNLYLVLLLSIFFSFYNFFLNSNQLYLQILFGFVLFRYRLEDPNDPKREPVCRT